MENTRSKQRNIKRNEKGGKKGVQSSPNSKSESYMAKNIFSFFLMMIVPNFVMILTYVVRQCDSSFLEFSRHLSEKSIIEIFQKIWLKDELDLKFGMAVIYIYSIFALFLMIIVPGKITKGSITPEGNVPKYKDNGISCYIFTLGAYILLAYCLNAWTPFSISMIYVKFPSILVCLNIISPIFCLFLYIKGLYFPTCPDKIVSGHFFFDYYWGIELHPKIKNIDVKVFTNCRFGLTVWALLIISFTKYDIENGNLNYGLIVNVILQMLYLTKFFWWEAGYYKTMDINVDHAGFYICWGCTVFVPSMYTLSTYHMIGQTEYRMPNIYYLGVLIIGIFSLIINYWADYQKQIFRDSNGKCLIWNKPPKIIEATYINEKGSIKKNILLVSGFWKIARHFHYFPELLLALCWCAADGFHHFMPFIYFIYLSILLVHRVKRDDEKCSKKYGKYYEEYKKIVPWKIIPFLY